jgi:hypothetical protein
MSYGSFLESYTSSRLAFLPNARDTSCALAAEERHQRLLPTVVGKSTASEENA